MNNISKLEKYKQNSINRNVIEPNKKIYHEIKGNWNDFFGNTHKIVLELACGWGEYTVSLASKFPKNNYVGMDLKGDRIWKASQFLHEKGLTNVAFLRSHINEILSLFEANEVDEIWLTFPDPREKQRDEKHRLTNANFLVKYHQILKPNGYFKFKTDDDFLFDYTLNLLKKFDIHHHEYTHDLYASDLLVDHHEIQTKYEKRWLKQRKKIKYMKFKFR